MTTSFDPPTPANRPPSSRPGRTVIRVEDDRTGMDPVTLERAVLDHLYFSRFRDRDSATLLDVFHAVSMAVRDRLVSRWLRTRRVYEEQDVRRVHYLSAEFLMGRALGMNLLNLGVYGTARDLLARHGLDLAQILDEERDAGLGNGGLGRLAACFLDSLAALEIPAYGYGIRYEYGIFEQAFRDGWQVERGDDWLRLGNPWEVPRHEYTVTVKFGGRLVEGTDLDGRYRVDWVDTKEVLGVPYDTPIAGFGNETVNTLRLWSARATREFNFEVFNEGDFGRAVEDKYDTETISKVLYPNDQSPEGKELRLRQQYFFVACSIHDIVRRHLRHHQGFDQFADKVVIQLNDTHPAIAVAELMRVLIDVHRLPWDSAWEITRSCIAYTNHTQLPEALEKWPVPLFEKLLPRHLQIIYEVNARFLRDVHIHQLGDPERKRRLSIIEEGPEKQVRMAHLAVVGSHSVNGVAALHTDLIKAGLFRDFAQMFPDKFNNKTNGVTPRRWILLANPDLANLITDRIGKEWVSDLSHLEALEPLADDDGFRAALREVKAANKRAFAEWVGTHLGIPVDPASLIDAQIKRIHEYKRQLLNVLHIVRLYLFLKENPGADVVPRTFVFGGKAAPGYVMAKQIIKLINDVATHINADPTTKGQLKVVFIPNYGVSVAEKIIPATDVSEQISMAGKEASGTGNMKFAMNGALTIGTLDGANIEIRERVGPDNFFLFGLNAEEVRGLQSSGYHPEDFIRQSDDLRRVIEVIEQGLFSPEEPDRFRPITDHLRQVDRYLCCADFDDYVRTQEEVSRVYRDPEVWSRKVVHNLANTGWFSSDRTIQEYARDIWKTPTVHVPPAPPSQGDLPGLPETPASRMTATSASAEGASGAPGAAGGYASSPAAEEPGTG